MKIDRTWTFSFEDNERNLLLRELETVGVPTDLGWQPMLKEIATTKQITLPLKEIERLSLELDVTRKRFTKRVSNKDYPERFPQINALSSGVELILFSYNRKNAF